ncbi:MAG: 50S ribosomal protein L21 [bacterium]|nr:50S ribosomal protein L21 [bacterium]
MATEKTTNKTSKGETKSAVKKTAKKPVAKPAEKVDKFAVIQTGGKQYLVTEGQVLKIEKIKDGKEGKAITFDEILLVVDGKDIKIGAPFVSGAKVTATIEGDERGKKITVLRYKSKTRYSKKKGHRQTYTKITITSIK